MSELYIGIMSGTSLDGIDFALVDLDQDKLELISTLAKPLATELKSEILALNTPRCDNELDRSYRLDRKLGQLFAQGCTELLAQNRLSAKDIQAIGSHGQTIRHQPDIKHAYSLQIGDPNTIAELTGISVVADFRRRDIAAGGQGAPLVPAFHQALFACEEKQRAIVNIGGMANISYLANCQNQQLSGFDTGPGNCLLDAWIQHQRQLDFDRDGAWAASGQVDNKLLERLLSCEFFHRPPPKSTGRELFNLAWLQQQLVGFESLPPQNVQATLCELSVQTIAQQLQAHTLASEIYVCGGGAFNQNLMQGLRRELPNCLVSTTEVLGLKPDWVEACAFAWLAKQCLAGLAGNHPDVTGASGFRVLGGIYPA